MRFGIIPTNTSGPASATPGFECHPGGRTEAAILFALAALGMAANVLVMGLVLTKHKLRSWTQGLLFHQGLVDCARSAILVPLGVSVWYCSPLRKCSVLETTFVLLVTVSTINMLTTVLNDAPLKPENDEDPGPLLTDTAPCMLFGVGIIWFAGMTINLGPTFLSGALASNQEVVDICPLVYGPMRHYILNILWIVVNLICVLLTCFHLRKLYKDLCRAPLDAVRAASLVTAMVSVQCDGQAQSGGGAMVSSSGAAAGGPRVRAYVQRYEREGLERVKMFVVTTVAYILFWAPLFLVTVVDPGARKYALAYEITLHVAFVHSFVNPALLLALHRGLRDAVADLLCCYCVFAPAASSLPPPASASVLPPPPAPPTITAAARQHLLPPASTATGGVPGPLPPPPSSSYDDDDDDDQDEDDDDDDDDRRHPSYMDEFL